jgi:hypothetical protein
MPYAAAILVTVFGFYFRYRAKKNHEDFLKISPGKTMNTAGLPKDSDHPTSD